MAIPLVESMVQNKGKAVKIAMKVLELLVGVISIIVMVKGVVVLPYTCELVFSSILRFWNSIRCLLSSTLYICIVINSMIVLIAISSSFHRHSQNDNLDDHDISATIDHDDLPSIKSPPPPPAPPPPPSESSRPRDIPEVLPPATTTTTISARITGTKFLSQDISPMEKFHGEIENLCVEKSILSSLTIVSKPHEIKKTSPNSLQELSKPMKGDIVTSNIPDSANRRKEIVLEKENERANNPLEDNENEDEDTLEATWKAITGGGKANPKNKELKKCETWDVVPPRRSVDVRRLDSEEVLPSTPKWKDLRKSETFNDAVSMTRRGGLIRRDPSTSLHEFNKRVESFIKNFNDNMRLQRQESDQRFLDMIKRGL